MNDKELFLEYIEKMDSIHDEYFRSLKSDLYKGHNSYLRMRMKGSSFFNDEWITTIEDCLYELGQIINNPREVTTSEGVLTPIELAKKINYESIQHLASHSQYVKDIDEKGNVIPAKILSQMSKDELHTYENRFIATFIRRLVLFIEKRYEFIKTTVNFDTRDVLYVKNKSIVNGQEVEIETKITVNKESDDNMAKIGKEYIARIEKMRTYINYYYVSPFMKALKNEKDVRRPILQTNVIRKNPYYHKCYETFLFIERFDSLGVQYTLDQNYQSFSDKQRRALNYILLSHLLSLESTKEFKPYKKTTKTYKPKVLSTIDDEIFTYSDSLKGPVKFVRADDKYIEYLNSKISKDIPERPNKEEKKYFEDEIQLKKDTLKHNKEVEKLLRRIRREIAKWEKKVAALLAAREIEEAELAKKQLEELRRQEEDILNKKREEIIQAALNDRVEEPIPEEVPQEEETQEEPVEEPVQIEETPAKEEPFEQVQEEVSPEIEEIPVEETVKEPVVEEAPAEEPIPEEVPQEEPVQEVEPEPILEEPQESEAQEEAPVPIEEMIPEPVEEQVQIEEIPSPVEEKPQEEAKVEQPVEEEKSAPKAKKSSSKSKSKKPAKPKEKPAKVEQVEPKPELVKKAKKKPAKKVAPKKEPAPEPKKDILEVIPGRFIVKTEEGYYIKNNKFSKIKGDAFIFENFNEAKQIKNRLGGKVIKL